MYNRNPILNIYELFFVVCIFCECNKLWL